MSVGSSCLTQSDKASHVLLAINAPPVIKRGVIRISFNDYNTFAEIDKFVNILEIAIIKQCHDIKKEVIESIDKNKTSKKKNDKKTEIKTNAQDEELNDLDD